jgi:hypothetical protein
MQGTCSRLGGGFHPVHELHRPALAVDRPVDRRGRLEEHPPNTVAKVVVDPGVLGEPRHDRRPVEGHDARPKERHLRDRGVGVAKEHLRIGGDELQIEERQEPDRIVPADRRDDPGDVRIRQRCMQVVRARLRVVGQERRVGERVGHLDDRDVEGLLQLTLPGLVPMRDLAGSAPRKRDGGDPVARAEPWGPPESADRILHVHETSVACGRARTSA